VTTAFASGGDPRVFLHMFMYVMYVGGDNRFSFICIYVGGDYRFSHVYMYSQADEIFVAVFTREVSLHRGASLRRGVSFRIRVG
jgi:hypothetical protein